MRQVMFTVCMICNAVTGCYDSDRDVKKKECNKCLTLCPPFHPKVSHGYCVKHFEEKMEQLREEASCLKG